MLKHAAPGTTHRDVDSEQMGIGIAVPKKGTLIKTEARTRQLTDHWQSNLLMQKKPNEDGIQCHDPRLNKHVTAQKAPEYNAHINIKGREKPVGTLLEKNMARTMSFNPNSLTSHRNRLGGTLDAEFADSAHLSTPRLTHMDSSSSIGELGLHRTGNTLTPPPNTPKPPGLMDNLYSHIGSPDEDEGYAGRAGATEGGEGNGGMFELTGVPMSRPGSQGAPLSRPTAPAYKQGEENGMSYVPPRPLTGQRDSPLTIDPEFPLLQPHEHHTSTSRDNNGLGVHMPLPMSPSAMAQRLRRYRIGSSPQQKVRNLLDDLQDKQNVLAAQQRRHHSPMYSNSNNPYFGTRGGGVDGRGHSLVRMASPGADGGLVATHGQKGGKDGSPTEGSPIGQPNITGNGGGGKDVGLRGDDSFWNESDDGAADARHQYTYLGKEQLTNYLMTLPPETLGSFVGENGRGLNLQLARLEVDSSALAQLSQADYLFLVQQVQQSAAPVSNTGTNGNGSSRANTADSTPGIRVDIGTINTNNHTTTAATSNNANAGVIGVKGKNKSSFGGGEGFGLKRNIGTGAQLENSVFTDASSRSNNGGGEGQGGRPSFETRQSTGGGDERSIRSQSSFGDDDSLNAIIKRSALDPQSIGLDANRSYSLSGARGEDSVGDEFQHLMDYHNYSDGAGGKRGSGGGSGRGRRSNRDQEHFQQNQSDWSKSSALNYYSEEDDIDGDSIPSLLSYDTAQHGQYLRDFENAKKRGARTKPREGQVYDAEVVRHRAEAVHRHQQPWKLYKEDGPGPDQNGTGAGNVFNMRGNTSPAMGRVSTGRTLGDRTNTGYRKPGGYDHEHGEESSRGAFSEMPLPTVVHPSHPPCHLCKRNGRLWCDHCKVVYCYKCWGTIDHHDAQDATTALHADVLAMKRTLKMESQLLSMSHVPEVPPISIQHNDIFRDAHQLENSLAATNSLERQGAGSLDQLGSNVNISLPFPSQLDHSLSMSISQGNSHAAPPSPSNIGNGEEEQNGGDGEENKETEGKMTDRLESIIGTEFESMDGSMADDPRTSHTEAPVGGTSNAKSDRGQMEKGKGTDNHGKGPSSHDARIAQFSRTNTEAHYFRQVTTPFVPPGSEMQTRLSDSYVEYDEINVIHFSPAKKDPAAVKAIQQRQAKMMAVTSERMKGYTAQVSQQKMREAHAAQIAALKIARLVQHKYPNRHREQGKRQIMRLEAARVDGRPEPKEEKGLGKLVPEHDTSSNNNATSGFGVTGVGLNTSLTIEQVKAMEAILHFENSPLNRELHIPLTNADGSPNRQPCDPRLIDQQTKHERHYEELQQELRHQEELEKLEQEKEQKMRMYKHALVVKKEALDVQKQLALSMRGKYSPLNGTRPPHTASPSSPATQKPSEEGKVQEQEQEQEQGQGQGQDNKDGGTAPTTAPTAFPAHLPISLTSGAGSAAANAPEGLFSNSVYQEQQQELPEEGPDPDLNSDGSIKLRRDDWGTHKMAAKSTKTGNFPQLPFRGPPYTVDLVTEEHFSTIVRPFSPDMRPRCRSTMAVDPRTVEERSLEIRKADTSVSSISKTHVLTSPIRSNRSVAANKKSDAEAFASKYSDSVSRMSHSASLQSGVGSARAGLGNGCGSGSIQKSKSGIGFAGTGGGGNNISLTAAGKASLWGTFRKTMGSIYDEDGSI